MKSRSIESDVILSIFPGIDLLGKAFEELGFCVVRGPDVLWGSDIRTFHPPAGVFAGVIGGPPCQHHSALARLVRHTHGEESVAEDLIPEFCRVISEAKPAWWLMENVPGAPWPTVDNYKIEMFPVNNRWLGEQQNRLRHFWFGSQGALSVAWRIDYRLFEHPQVACAVVAGHGQPLGARRKGHKNYTIAEMCELQGLPPDYLTEAPFTAHGKRKVIGNGVPLPMGRAITKAVKRVMYETEAER